VSFFNLTHKLAQDFIIENFNYNTLGFREAVHGFLCICCAKSYSFVIEIIISMKKGCHDKNMALVIYFVTGNGEKTLKIKPLIMQYQKHVAYCDGLDVSSPV
jgi:hypothetical protein